MVDSSNQITNPLVVYIGYDPREHEAYEVCVKSIRANTSSKVEVIPLNKSYVLDVGMFTRDGIYPDQKGSTEFAFTRFLVPRLERYKGVALFVDCDFVFTTDIRELFYLYDEQYAVMCVQHDYTPKGMVKMDNQIQKSYPRKNWSSLMLFNCGHEDCLRLNPWTISNMNAGWLHEMRWTTDANIGSLPKEWNWLVGEAGYDWNQEGLPKAIHYTLGCPFMQGYENCEFADQYNKYK